MDDDYKLTPDLSIGDAVEAYREEQKKCRLIMVMDRSQAAATELDGEDNNDNSDDHERTISDDGFKCESSCGFCMQCQCEKWYCLEHIKNIINYLSQKEEYDQFLRLLPIEVTVDDDVTENKLKGIKLFSCWSCNRNTSNNSLEFSAY